MTYLPVNFSVDVGTLLTQYLLEPIGKKGIHTNWVLSGGNDIDSMQLLIETRKSF